MREKMWYFSFWIWLILLSVMISSHIRFPTNVRTYVSLRIMESLVYVHHTLLPFICWWATCLFPCPGYWEGYSPKHACSGSLWKPMDGLDRTSILTIFSVFICEQYIAALPSILLECLCVCVHVYKFFMPVGARWSSKFHSVRWLVTNMGLTVGQLHFPFQSQDNWNFK